MQIEASYHSIANCMVRDVLRSKALMQHCAQSNSTTRKIHAQYQCHSHQVEFISGLMQADRLQDRMLIWAEEEIRAGNLPPKSDIVLRAILFQGILQRGEVHTVLGMSERAARRITSALQKTGAITSASTRAPLQLAFPAKYAERWMPGLFPAI